MNMAADTSTSARAGANGAPHTIPFQPGRTKLSEAAASLKERIETKKARVGIIGMGYVGYPMAEITAYAGFNVTGIEVNSGRVDQINRGESYIQDVPQEAAKTLVDAGRLSATSDYSVVEELDVILITVPTPLVKTGDPDLSFVVSVLEAMKPHMHAGMLISLESTTYPGTTEDLFVPAVEEAGLKLGEEIFIAFSPERIDPGNTTHGPKNTPKVVGGITPACTEIAAAFYGQIVDKTVPMSSTSAAEMVKLYENTFRAINIGLVNELAIICHLLEVNVWEIIDAAATKPFGFMPFYPGPGLGGHCIPIDPSYLAWKMRSLEYKTRFIDLATEINTDMPRWIVNRAAALLNEEKKALNGSKIMLIGMAYKNDIDDLRESPALDVYMLLQRRGAEMSYHDPYCPSMKMDEGGVVESQPLTAEVISEQDLIIITTGHKKKVDYDLILEHSSTVFDTRYVLSDKADGAKAQVVFL
ncbi:UDP-N-acetyl-D-glucosamine 6-dehydrogenase [bacterium BMS3Bbin04]|nr:UDP-N-acetyl-D-glucosamine 6-dehydrogenase [bacterium BMS3Bbin04]